MAARRLVIVMLVLLGISAAAAALAPTRDSGDETVGSTTSEAAGSTTTTPEVEPDPAEHESSTFDIKVGGRKLPVVPVELGERVTLIIRSKVADQLEIPALGVIEPVAPGAPARFELLPEVEGSLGIRLVNAGTVVARIEVSAGAVPAQAAKPRKQ